MKEKDLDFCQISAKNEILTRKLEQLFAYSDWQALQRAESDETIKNLSQKMSNILSELKSLNKNELPQLEVFEIVETMHVVRFQCLECFNE
jgi:hypothetical protein